MTATKYLKCDKCHGTFPKDDFGFRACLDFERVPWCKVCYKRLRDPSVPLEVRREERVMYRRSYSASYHRAWCLKHGFTKNRGKRGIERLAHYFVTNSFNRLISQPDLIVVRMRRAATAAEILRLLPAIATSDVWNNFEDAMLAEKGKGKRGERVVRVFPPETHPELLFVKSNCIVSSFKHPILSDTVVSFSQEDILESADLLCRAVEEIGYEGALNEARKQ